MMFTRLLALLALLYSSNQALAQKNLPATQKAIEQISQNNHLAMLVTLNRNGKVLLSHHAQHDFVPASLIKLYTSILTIDVLGPAAKLNTIITAQYFPESQTTLLDIYGSADPTLTDQDISQLLDQLAEQKVPLDPMHTQIKINQLKPYRFGPGWMLDDLTNCEVPYRDWLNLGSENCPNQSPNNTPNHAMEAVLGLTNSPSLQLKQILEARYTQPATTPIQEEEISTSAQHSSLPVEQLNQIMLEKSNNHYAESLYLNSAQTLHLLNTSPQKTSAAIKTWLEHQHKNLKTPTAWIDGSGLSYYNNATASQLNTAIQTITHQPKLMRTIGASLPIAGQTGTLKHGFKDTPFTGKLHAKTGNLRNFSGISGFITCQGRPRWNITLLDYSAQDNKGQRYENLNKLISALAKDLEFSKQCLPKTSTQ